MARGQPPDGAAGALDRSWPWPTTFQLHSVTTTATSPPPPTNQRLWLFIAGLIRLTLRLDPMGLHPLTIGAEGIPRRPRHDNGIAPLPASTNIPPDLLELQAAPVGTPSW